MEMTTKRPLAISKATHLTWIDLDALSIEGDWQQKAKTLRARRWRIIRHAAGTL